MTRPPTFRSAAWLAIAATQRAVVWLADRIFGRYRLYILATIPVVRLFIAFPVDPRDQFRFVTDLTVRGKESLKGIGAKLISAPAVTE